MVKMNLFPNQCGWEVSEWWCVFTSSQTIISGIILFVIFLIGCLIGYFIGRQKRKEESA